MPKILAILSDLHGPPPREIQRCNDTTISSLLDSTTFRATGQVMQYWYQAKRLVPAMVFGFLCLVPLRVVAQVGDPRYQTRVSDCRHEPPPGARLAARRFDSGIISRGYRAERLVNVSVDASRLNGGEIIICSEYGRVEIIDSDDTRARLQIRMEGSGEGSSQPATAAGRIIQDTKLEAFMTAEHNRLLVRVWHSTLGFTNPGGQPTFVSVRLALPARGSYSVSIGAFHGSVAIRRLTLERATIRGNVGDKFKGIPGYIGNTELDNVNLAGDVDIDNLAGLPGIRARVSSEVASLSAPILVKATVRSSCRLSAVTGGDINIAIQPAPDLGVQALGESNSGRVTVMINDGVPSDPVGESAFRTRRFVSTAGYDTKQVRLALRAASSSGNVNIGSIPAAPLLP